MENIYLREMELSLYKMDTYFEIMINSDITTDGVYTEGFKDVVNKIKTTILKYAIIFDKYAENVLNILQLYKQKRSVEKNMKVIGRALKKNPDIANTKIKYRLYDDWKSEIDYETSISNNLAYRIENLDEDWVTDIMDAYYKDIDAENHSMEETTIQEAYEDVQEVLKDIDKAIDKQRKTVKKTCEKLSKSNNLSIKQLSLLKKFLLSMQKHTQNNIFKLSVHLDDLYNEIHRTTKNTIEEEAKKYVKRRYSSEATAEKNAQYMGKVKVLDYEIELYRTDKYLISEYTTGNCVYFDREFINLPKSHQAAILAHEYGHIVNGHTLLYDRKLRDEYKLAKSLKKTVKKYDKMVAKSKFADLDEVADDSLLIYLLVELDADRYAAKTVGKNVIKKALLTDYKKMTKNLDMSPLEKEYYMFIAKTRTSMI